MSGPGHHYRSDIDGLRAVAVVPVVLFHAGMPGFAGGFVGVDVFFVISGFLITAIIADEIARERFSILGFYERRVRRIFPALFAVLAFSYVAALVLFLPRDFAAFGDSAAAATLFVSNIYFWRTSDYFGAPAHLLPLLHTWSLAVEEQFYIAFPLILVAIHRWGRRAFVPWVLLFFVASLAVSQWSAETRPVASFYLTPSRAFELMLGALLALGAVPQIANRWVREILAAAGLGLIAWSVVEFSTASVFPGFNALIPCGGAALVLYACDGRDTFSGRLLSMGPVVFVGLISYSLYLWHWPLLAFARYWSGEVLGPAAIGVVVLASFAVATASWKYVEQPFRTGALRPPQRPLFQLAGGAMAAAVALGAFAHVSSGSPGRFDGYSPPHIAGLESFKQGQCFLGPEQGPWNYAGVETCRKGEPGARTVLVWGDSFAAHLMPGFGNDPEAEVSYVQYTHSGCPPVLAITPGNRPHCAAFNQQALKLIELVKPDVVIMAARWEHYMPRFVAREQLQATIDAAAIAGAKAGSKVIVMAQSPTFDFASPYDFVYRKDREWARVTHDTGINRLLAGLRNAKVFDPMPVFCKGAACELRDGKGFHFFDGGHYSYTGSIKLAEALMTVMGPMVTPPEEPEEEPSVAASGAVPSSAVPPMVTTAPAPAPSLAAPALAAPPVAAPSVAAPSMAEPAPSVAAPAPSTPQAVAPN